jgi:hypothetical protein
MDSSAHYYYNTCINAQTKNHKMHDEASSSSSSSSSSSFFFHKTKPRSKTLQKLQHYTSVLRPCFLHQAKKNPARKTETKENKESVTEC